MISIMLHKPNVFAELHGWSPKYLTDPLKREIRSRRRRKVMFGGDYPLFRYERLVDDWKALGYADDVLGDVFSGNAARLLGLPEGDA
jgi:predicted TIM-barrel fold metal-dependent hydrolase